MKEKLDQLQKEIDEQWMALNADADVLPEHLYEEYAARIRIKQKTLDALKKVLEDGWN